MDFKQLMEKMTAAVVAGNGREAASCFTPEGTYHDVFYGAFTGHDAIADMIENYFHRDGEDFIWDLHDPVDNGTVGYVRYVFSYTSKMEASAGRRSVFESVSLCRLRDGRIDEYREIGNAATGLSMLGFPDERLVRFIGKEIRHLKERAEAERHFNR